MKAHISAHGVSRIVSLQVTLILSIFLLLAACTPETDDLPGDSERLPEAVAASSDRRTPSPVHEPPTSTSASPASPSKTATATEVLEIPSDSQEQGDHNAKEPGKTSALPDDVVIRFQVSGGFAGIEEEWLIYGDGRVHGPDDWQGAVDSEKVAALLVAIDSARFFEMDDSYVPLNSCCDRLNYALAVRQGEHVKIVRTIDAAPTQPASLNGVIEAVRALLAASDLK